MPRSTFLLGEITSRATAPLQHYFLATPPEVKPSRTYSLFGEIKAQAGSVETEETIPPADIGVIDESFIDYSTFLNVIDKTSQPAPRNKR
jgi:hypothetical protein